MPYSRDPYAGPFDLPLLLKLLLFALVLGLALNYLSDHPDLFSLLVVVVACAVALVLTHVVTTVLRVQYANRWGPVRSRPAVVTRKWTDTFSVDAPAGDLAEQALSDALDQDTSASLYESWSFWVAFDLGPGKEEEFRVRESVYTTLEEGMEGVLTYRGERLISFLPSDRPEGPTQEREPPSQWRPGPHLPRK